MYNSTTDLNKLKRSLSKNPRISGVNNWFRFSFLDKRAGKRDAQENQICENGEGHITPHIEDKLRLYDSYVDKIYLRTSLNLEPLVREANALVVEISLIHGKKENNVVGNSEEAQRQSAIDAVNNVKKEMRKVEILTRIAEIRAESDMVDESLKHHIERADGIFRSRVSRYWKGILSATNDKLEHFPFLEQRECEGRIAYIVNRKKLITLIDETIVKGGVTYDVE